MPPGQEGRRHLPQVDRRRAGPHASRRGLVRAERRVIQSPRLGIAHLAEAPRLTTRHPRRAVHAARTVWPHRLPRLLQRHKIDAGRSRQRAGRAVGVLLARQPVVRTPQLRRRNSGCQRASASAGTSLAGGGRAHLVAARVTRHAQQLVRRRHATSRSTQARASSAVDGREARRQCLFSVLRCGGGTSCGAAFLLSPRNLPRRVRVRDHQSQ